MEATLGFMVDGGCCEMFDICVEKLEFTFRSKDEVCPARKEFTVDNSSINGECLSLALENGTGPLFTEFMTWPWLSCTIFLTGFVFVPPGLRGSVEYGDAVNAGL